MQLQHLFAATLVAAVPTVASAATVTTPFLETFDDATTDVSFGYNDFGAASSGTGVNGTGPGWTVTGGQAVFFNNTDFGDVGAADVVTDTAGVVSFSTSADFDVTTINFTGTNLGVYAFGQSGLDFSENFVGLYAFVDQNGASSSDYTFRLIRGAGGTNTPLQQSASFDLTDGTPDFSIDLVGVADGLGNFDITATLTPDGNTPIVLTDTVTAGDLLQGNRFGVRVNPTFNTVEVGIDNLAVNVVIPEPTSAMALGALGLLGLRRRR